MLMLVGLDQSTTLAFSEIVQSEFNKLRPSDHVIGDSACPLSISIITSFRDTGCLSKQEMRFNVEHSSVRGVVERAFVLLKGKFRRLKSLAMSLEHQIPEVIMVCLYLHNFILKMNVKIWSPFPRQRLLGLQHCNGAEKRLALTASL